MSESTDQGNKRFGVKHDRRGRPHDWDYKNQAPVCKTVSMPPQSGGAPSKPQGVMTKADPEKKPVKRRQGKKTVAK